MPLGASVITDALSVHGVTPSLYEAYKKGSSVSVDHKLLIKMIEDEVQSEYTPSALKQF